MGRHRANSNRQDYSNQPTGTFDISSAIDSSGNPKCPCIERCVNQSVYDVEQVTKAPQSKPADRLEVLLEASAGFLR